MMEARPGSREGEAKSHVCGNGQCRQEDRGVAGRSGPERVCVARGRRGAMSRCPGRVLEDGWKRATLHREDAGERRTRQDWPRSRTSQHLLRFPNATYNVTILSATQHTPASPAAAAPDVPLSQGSHPGQIAPCAFSSGRSALLAVGHSAQRAIATHALRCRIYMGVTWRASGECWMGRRDGL